MKQKLTLGQGILQFRGSKSCSEIQSKMNAVIKEQVDMTCIKEYLYHIQEYANL